VIADEAGDADRDELDTLEKEFKASVAACVGKLIEGSNATEQAPVSLAIEHARRAIEARRIAIGTRAAPEARESGKRRGRRPERDGGRACLERQSVMRSGLLSPEISGFSWRVMFRPDRSLKLHAGGLDNLSISSNYGTVHHPDMFRGVASKAQSSKRSSR